MWRTNLKVLLVAAVVLGFYTSVAHIIPQLHSDVPEALNLGSNATPEQLVAAGEKVYNGAGGCTACHGLGTRAPNLLTDFNGLGPIGGRCATRQPGVDCKAYLYTSLKGSMDKPASYRVAGFGPIMPDMQKQLTQDQVWAVVAFLESNGGTVDVTADDIAKSGGAAGTNTPAAGVATGATGGNGFSATTEPLAIIHEQGCLGCHKLGSEGNAIAPPFDHLGSGATKDFIRQCIIHPNSVSVKGYEKLRGMMPTFFGQKLSAAQLEILVDFLASRK